MVETGFIKVRLLIQLVTKSLVLSLVLPKRVLYSLMQEFLQEGAFNPFFFLNTSPVLGLLLVVVYIYIASSSFYYHRLPNSIAEETAASQLVETKDMIIPSLQQRCLLSRPRPRPTTANCAKDVLVVLGLCSCPMPNTVLLWRLWVVWPRVMSKYTLCRFTYTNSNIV